MASLRDPEALCERLGLAPSLYQRTLMNDFYDRIGKFGVLEIPSEHTVHAVAVCALWRMMLLEGSKCFVITSSRELEKRFTDFMFQITTQIDPAMASVCKWTGPKRMLIGGSEMRCLPNKPERFQGIHDEVVTWVVLGAGSSETHFGDALKALKTTARGVSHRIIEVW